MSTNALILFRDLYTGELKVAPTTVVWHYTPKDRGVDDGLHEVGVTQAVEEVATVTAEEALAKVIGFLGDEGGRS